MAQIIGVSGSTYNKKFNVFNVEGALLNSLRQIMLSEVKSYVFANDINAVVMKTNETKFHNEYLIKRFSMIPINIIDDNFDTNNYKFVIDVKNDTNQDKLYVTTEHFEVYSRTDNNGWVHEPSLKNKFFKKDPISKDYIYICPLSSYGSNDGERLNVECHPSIGVGGQYGGFVVASKAVFYPMINVKLSEQVLNEKIKMDKITGKKEIETITKLFYNTDAYRCYNENDYNEPYEFTFDVESVGIFDVDYILTSSFEILIENMERVKNLLVNNAVSFQYSTETKFEAYDLNLANETPSVGCILQAYLYKLFSVSDNTKYKLTYIAYDMNHPLEKITSIRYGLDKSINSNVNKKEILKDMTLKAIDVIIDESTYLKKQWLKLTKNKK